MIRVRANAPDTFTQSTGCAQSWEHQVWDVHALQRGYMPGRQRELRWARRQQRLKLDQMPLLAPKSQTRPSLERRATHTASRARADCIHGATFSAHGSGGAWRAVPRWCDCCNAEQPPARRTGSLRRRLASRGDCSWCVCCSCTLARAVQCFGQAGVSLRCAGHRGV